MTTHKTNSLGDTNRFRLKNGATLLVKEDPSTPVVSLNLWIEAGSVDEKPDERGMAHLIEHMIFKGTKARGVGEISRQVEALGGYLNAFTSFEHTCFYVVLPSSQIQKALEIEFDAYLHSTFDAQELAKEKEVVFEEMRMRRDDPWSWSWEILFDLLYQKNPYHWPVIGDYQILKDVPRERLMKYYQKHYVPSNTVISITGNVSTPEILAWVKKNFESVRRPAPPRRRLGTDSEPKGLRLHLEAGDVQQIYLSLGFPTMPLDHPDSAPLEILCALLGEGSASRFNLNLREKTQWADEVAAEYFSGKYGGSVVFQALTSEKKLEDCLRGLAEEAKRTYGGPIPDEEIQKVKNKLKASKVFEKQSMDGQAKTLGFWELQGGYELEEKFLKALDAVTPEDIKRVGELYLHSRRATLVLYHPRSVKLRKDPAYWASVLKKGMEGALADAVPHRIRDTKIKKWTLRDGSALWVKERKNLPLVSLAVFLNGGFHEEKKDQQGITSLMTKCLQKGTLTKNHEVLSHEVESYAAHLDAFMEKDYWGLALDVLSSNFERSFDLMVETLLEPAFSPKEVEKEKRMQISAIARMKDDPSEYAMMHSDLITFGKSPYGHRVMGTEASISGLTPADIRRWHQVHLSKSPRTWVAVGDFDPLKLKKMIEDRVSIGRSPRVRRKQQHSPVIVTPQTLKLNSESQQANIVLGFSAPSFHAKDYFPFRVLNTLLNGMGGRLFLEVREKRSLAYSVFASHDAGALGGIYQIYIGCAPAKAAQAQKEVLKVLDSFAKGNVTPEELKRAKTYMIGLYQMGFQSNRSQVHSYARYELTGMGASGVERFPEMIQKVTLEEIRSTAKKYLETPAKTWVLLTPPAKKEGKETKQ